MPHVLTSGERVFAVADIYGDDASVFDANIGNAIVTNTGIAGEIRLFTPSGVAEGKRVEAVYVQFDQLDGTNISDRHTAGWVPRKAVCTSRFGHVGETGMPCVFCGYKAA